MSRKYLLFCEDIGAIIEIDPRTITSGDYGQLYDEIKRQGNKRGKFDFASIIELDEHESLNGVFWDWELAGPDGASYRIHCLPYNTEEAIQKAEQHIRHSFDCVRLYRNRIKKLIRFEIPTFKHEEYNMRTGQLEPAKGAAA